jgi:hypothetical protein
VQSVTARVQRLIAWTERQPNENTTARLYAKCAAIAAGATLAATYSELLVRVHAATEWLVR